MSKNVTNTTLTAVSADAVEAFMQSPMSYPVNDDFYEETPAELLRRPGADIGVDMLADEWIEMIINSDDPSAEFSFLRDHLLGVLGNIEMVERRYNEVFERAA